MGLFDRGRERQEARTTLSQLYIRHVSSRRRFEDWKTATNLLRDIYTRERAAENTVSAERRIGCLEVPEPQPALEDFLPADYSPHMPADPLVVFQEVRSRFESDWYRHPQREQARLAELEYAKTALAQMLAAQREEAARVEEEAARFEAARHRARLALWSRYTTLDDDVASLTSTERQVDAQNTKIENRIRRLSQILADGLPRLPLPIAPDVSAATGPELNPKEVANDAEYQLELATQFDNELDIETHFRVAYSPDSRQLVIECQLPDVTVVPKAKHYRYIKSRNEINETARPQSQIKATYADAIAQVTLLCTATAFATDSHNAIDVVVFNGIVDTIDPRSGQRIRPCLITVRVTREKFAELNLEHVDPQACLKHLSAGVSKSPTELAPVKPVLEFDMVDPRFVEATDAVRTMDDRPNLLELTPTEFETLIQNLFSSMGLEAKQTRASRDGGVDCIAYDTRPIFGGKVVIQAKRYKNTVGVSAVRDLFGTLQNEGASKGILVTTSGYGSASFDFAVNKPIELIEGAQLLYLLEEHTGLKARIEPPDDWRDPIPDGGEAY
jgi:HJR/Mrr/RecB family endonuclease